MKLEPYIILKLFLNFRDFESSYSCRLYSYKEKSVYHYVVILKLQNKIFLQGGTIFWDCKCMHNWQFDALYKGMRKKSNKKSKRHQILKSLPNAIFLRNSPLRFHNHSHIATVFNSSGIFYKSLQLKDNKVI